jgi:hypothetical protein
MKTFTRLLSAAAMAAFASACYAGDLQITQNAHGQTATLYRPAQTASVALFVDGRGVGARTTAAEQSETKAAIKQNAHGQSAVQFERGSTR